MIPELILVLFLLGPDPQKNECVAPECSLFPTTSGLAVTLTSPKGGSEIALYCNTAGPDPEDIYGCTLQPGHDLDGLLRLILRAQQNEEKRHQAELKKIFEEWKRSIKEIQKALPKPYIKDNKGRS